MRCRGNLPENTEIVPEMQIDHKKPISDSANAEVADMSRINQPKPDDRQLFEHIRRNSGPT
jgi:hypothetical protein